MQKRIIPNYNLFIIQHVVQILNQEPDYYFKDQVQCTNFLDFVALASVARALKILVIFAIWSYFFTLKKLMNISN